jgi:hypothetical protein
VATAAAQLAAEQIRETGARCVVGGPGRSLDELLTGDR